MSKANSSIPEPSVPLSRMITGDPSPKQRIASSWPALTAKRSSITGPEDSVAAVDVAGGSVALGDSLSDPHAVDRPTTATSARKYGRTASILDLSLSPCNKTPRDHFVAEIFPVSEQPL